MGDSTPTVAADATAEEKRLLKNAAARAWRIANPNKCREYERRKLHKRRVANMTPEQIRRKNAATKRAHDKWRAANPLPPKPPRKPGVKSEPSYQMNTQRLLRARRSGDAILLSIADDTTLTRSERAAQIGQINAQRAQAKRDGLRRNKKQRAAAYMRRMRKTRPEFKLAQILRARLYCALRSAKSNGSAVRDCGVTMSKLRLHLESMFQPGWTWENWGVEWEIDHVFPFAGADIVGNRAQFLAVNNWRNLMPLSYSENKRKNGKITPEAQALFDALVAEFTERLAQAS